MNEEMSFKEAMSEIRKNMSLHIEHTIIRAQLCSEYYTELVNQGFSKDDALTLCKDFKL